MTDFKCVKTEEKSEYDIDSTSINDVELLNDDDSVIQAINLLLDLRYDSWIYNIDEGINYIDFMSNKRNSLGDLYKLYSNKIGSILGDTAFSVDIKRKIDNKKNIEIVIKIPQMDYERSITL